MRGVVLTVLALTTACTPPIMRDAEEAVRKELSDPASSEFRDLRLAKLFTMGDLVCGEVNAQNRMGGYVGYRKFAYYVATKDVVISDGEYVAEFPCR